MGKRGALAFILALTAIILSCAVYAEHTSSASVQPLEIYETNTGVFDLRIINTKANPLIPFNILFDGSRSSINDISIVYDDFTLLASTIPSDWTRSLANDVLAYATNFSAVSSGGSLVIAVQATADKIDANKSSVWTITTKDLKNETFQNTVTISIINDDTPPVIENPLPYDGMYIKQGTNNQETRISAVDPETDVKQVNFNYDNCAFLNETKNIILNENGNVYLNILDLSSYPDSTEVCFSFNAENNGGGIAIYPGKLTIDGIAPSVTLVSPDNNALMNSQSDFVFIAQDNLAPNMSCELLVDGNVEGNVDALNNVTTTFSVQNVSEGRHEWAVRCTDLAGWSNTSETRTYTLDRTPPLARIQSLVSFIIAAGTQLDFIVTDNFKLDGIWFTYSNFSVDNPNYEYMKFTVNKTTYLADNESHFSILTDIWEEGYHDIYVSTDDAAGNNMTYTFLVAVDKTAPNVTLVSPTNESNVDANFTFDAADNYDNMIDCTLYVNGQANGTGIVNTSQGPTGLVNSMLGPGNYTWRIDCIDDAGNNGQSETWNVTIIDTTGPVITFNNVGVVVRGSNIMINATITDVSGVKPESVYATMEDPNMVAINVTLTKEEGTDNYIGSYPTATVSALGDYIARVFAEDSFANSNSNYAAYELTYAYVITLTLSPNPAQVGQQVTASGTVAYDSGETAKDEFITLMLPNTSIDAAMENGGFSYVFNAPDAAALYDITATITPENGFSFSATGTLNVVNEPQGETTTTTTTTTTSSVEDKKGHSSGICPNCGPCSSDDDCGGNKICRGGICTERDCGKDGDCGNGKQCNNGRCVGQADEIVEEVFDKDADQVYHYCTDGTCDSDESCKSCPEDCGACKGTKGIGRATGFFNISGIRSDILWTLLAIGLISFVVVYLYQHGNPFERDKDNLGINKYMDERAKK